MLHKIHKIIEAIGRINMALALSPGWSSVSGDEANMVPTHKANNTLRCAHRCMCVLFKDFVVNTY